MLRSYSSMARLTMILILYFLFDIEIFSNKLKLAVSATVITDILEKKNDTSQLPASLEIESSQKIDGIEAGSTPSLTCKLSEPGQIWWKTKDKNLTTIRESDYRVRLDLKKISRNDKGNYSCIAKTNGGKYLEKTISIHVIEPGKIEPASSVRIKAEKPCTLECHFHGYPLINFTWMKGNDSESIKQLESSKNISNVNETYVIMRLHFESVFRKDNGTYSCIAYDYYGPVIDFRILYVIDKPQINIDFIKAVGFDKVFLNWTVNDGNMPIKSYRVKTKKDNSTTDWQYYPEQINGSNTNYVLKGFSKSTKYQISITAVNDVGDSVPYNDPRWIETLKDDPVFVPSGMVKGSADASITLGWSAPPPNLREHVHYYTLMLINGDKKKEAMYPAQEFNDYVFVDLQPATTYQFQIAACSDYTKQCGNWSNVVNGTTMDGICSPPENLTVACKFDNISRMGFVSVSWTPPLIPNGVITRYFLALRGVSYYRNNKAQMDTDYWGPSEQNVKETDRVYEFKKVPTNTNYTVRIYGVTRLKSPGQEAIGSCIMPVSRPEEEHMNMRSWRKIENEGKQLFKLYLPRITERNGPICCYRIFMIKLAPQQTSGDLPLPENLEVHSYHYAHASPAGGVYLAEMFDSDHLHSEIFLGDGQEVFNRSSACEKCIGLRPKPSPTLHLIPDITDTNSNSSTISITQSSILMNITHSSMNVISSTVETTIQGQFKNKTDQSVSQSRKKRRFSSDINLVGNSIEPDFHLPDDGFIDNQANYTGFIEVIVYSQDQLLPTYSHYLNTLSGGFEPRTIIAEENEAISIILQITVVLTLMIIILLSTLCIFHRYTKREEQSGDENINLRNSFRHLCRSLRGRHQLVAANPPDMPPISKTELLQIYMDRHRDSDYGFQHEFELLPDRFTDRTTRASDSRENLYKNRYPDIKCYDQTRVKLSQIDGISGSDYINANFVLGYKERKKFICAQGPMENTVCDYWRMIWEHHLELVLMLTNLEEYSKTKCAKYWPDKTETKNFGDICVQHIKQRTYSDYVVRELKMTKTGERDARTIIQYHFLVWKDFMAPEHPHAILRFIKRVNEAYSLEKGPILVHCSAGVGRTGTLVALDSLLQQLDEEGEISIFNTVCDLRHQRNFLVQSLKQYIFIYRSLMEMAIYGDTEIPISHLKSTVEKLRHKENGKDKSKMEDEYDKMTSVLEERKSFSVGCGEENKAKNQSELVIPYDRNRVILPPVLGREHSTYINASFIEGYDNSESFIITQDPLDTTIPDFWRMISDTCITTIVMLSDLNESPRKCPRYWPEDEAVHEHIQVRYIQSESCPYYTRRELCVTNTKTDETLVVTQYQYHGWPTVEGEVPEVTRGVIELVNQTGVMNSTSISGPLLVHCSFGSDRSSMFVALSILVQQLRTEKRVDIFTTTKKLRSQRHGMISSFAQYDFLHRAIMNYADLHNLTEDETSS
ncbi:tyrosine-protein phosphatase 69D isoform X2 [Aphidius gifuensis]|uniref:tyrosine-protein phosphatase 69D isoform X2 n=1 Tax=Aphidius gifuensis TaxID=684658 RepID=UPI001CDC5FEE|nr:tyrosine-protein phosphatase 69D isoform X2 [Aphidius gifuensis]